MAQTLNAVEIARLIDPDHNPEKAGSGRVNVRCPAHADKNPSLTVWIDQGGKVAFNCHAGCEHHRILEAMPTEARQVAEASWRPPPVTILIPKRHHRPQPPSQPTSRTVEAEYPYNNAEGEPLYLVRRYPGKRLRQFHHDDGWVAGRPDHIPLVPYRLPDLLEAKKAGDIVYIVEGEKDADTLARLGITATTNVGGAGKWTEELNIWFTGLNVAVIPDNDPPGHQHAQTVAEHLTPIALTVRLVNLPNLAEKGDVTDWLETHTADELEQIVAQTPPEGQKADEFRLSPGDTIFDYPDGPEPIWGDGQEVLWARGEPLMIYGPTGIGKTTVAGRLLLSLIGIGAPQLLGHPISPLSNGKRVLYVAADRPRQAMRSLRRMVTTADRESLRQKLAIEHHRQLWASDKDPTMLYRACQQAEATVIVIDSGKDVAGGPLKDEAAAKALMDSIQVCISNEVEVILLHHPRKADQQMVGVRELDLDDVYGSVWLTAGVGSVLLVAGIPGQGIFTLTQLKAPAMFTSPMTVAINYETGALERRNQRDLVEQMRDSGHPFTITQAASFLFATPAESVTDGQRKKAERELKRMVTDGQAKVDTSGRQHTYQWIPAVEIRFPK